MLGGASGWGFARRTIWRSFGGTRREGVAGGTASPRGTADPVNCCGRFILGRNRSSFDGDALLFWAGGRALVITFLIALMILSLLLKLLYQT